MPFFTQWVGIIGVSQLSHRIIPFKKVNKGICDAVNKAPYYPRSAQNLAADLLGSSEFTRTTIPGQSMPNVRLAGQCKERTIVINPETQETLVQRVTFDQRGFPIFDPYG